MAKDEGRDVDLAATIGEIRASIANLQGGQERLANITQMLSTRPVAVEPQAQPEPNYGLEIDWRDLPDPNAEPEAFRKKLAKRMNKAVNEGVRVAAEQAAAVAANNARAAAASADAYNGLWEEFKGAFPYLSDAEEVIATVAGSELRDLASQGINIETYISNKATREKFLDSVAAGTANRLEELGVDVEALEHSNAPADDGAGGLHGPHHPAPTLGGPARGERLSVDSRVDDAGRTMGITGGDGGRSWNRDAASPGARQMGGQSDLISELKAEQNRVGIFGRPQG